MSSDNIVMEGFDQLYQRLDALEPNANRVARQALEEGAEIVLRAVRQRAGPHLRSGRLQAALRVGDRRSRKGSRSIAIGTFGRDAPHAHLVEFGHGGPAPAAPHPFLRPAYEETKAEAYDLIRQKLVEAIERWD